MRSALAVFGIGLLFHSTGALANYIDNEGREWLTPDVTVGTSWTNIASTCSAATGKCTGVFTPGDGQPAIDLTGYTWATRDDVRDLYYEAAALSPGSLDSYNAAFSGPATALAFFSNFGYTFSTDNLGVMAAFTRTLDYSPEQGIFAYLGTVFGPNPLNPSGRDSFFGFAAWPINVPDITYAAYVYREVPEPGTLALAALGIVFVWLKRRRDRMPG